MRTAHPGPARQLELAHPGDECVIRLETFGQKSNSVNRGGISRFGCRGRIPAVEIGRRNLRCQTQMPEFQRRVRTSGLPFWSDAAPTLSPTCVIRTPIHRRRYVLVNSSSSQPKPSSWAHSAAKNGYDGCTEFPPRVTFTTSCNDYRIRSLQYGSNSTHYRRPWLITCDIDHAIVDLECTVY